MPFAENINRICREKGTTLTALMKSLGKSTSKVSAINTGSLPRESDLQLYARALGCRVVDFFAVGEAVPVCPGDDDEQDILRVYRSLSRRQKHEFMAAVYAFERKNTPV